MVFSDSHHIAAPATGTDTAMPAHQRASVLASGEFRMDLPPPLLAFVMMLPSDCEMWHLSDVASAGHVYVSVIMRTALGPFRLRARPFQNKMQVIDPITRLDARLSSTELTISKLLSD